MLTFVISYNNPAAWFRSHWSDMVSA